MFEIGKRVKVAEDEICPEYVGARGTIIDVDDIDLRFSYHVRFDAMVSGEDSDWFSKEELAFIDAGKLEGTLLVGYDAADGNYYITIDGKNLWSELHPHNSKRVKLMWEVVDGE